MANPIYLRIGTAERVLLSDLINSLNYFLQILKDFDASISNNPRGSVQWEVFKIEQNGHRVVGVEPRLKRQREKRDFSGIVEEQLIKNANMLYATGERNEFMPDRALAGIGKLATLTPRIGTSLIYTKTETPSVETQAPINEITLNNVKQLTKAKYKAYGSIVGSLDSINVHKGNEFRVWDEKTNKAVTCKFRESDLERVKSRLKQRVVVYGSLESNSAGIPLRIDAERFDVLAKRRPPTIQEVSGLVEDFTGGLSLKDYMEMLSNE